MAQRCDVCGKAKLFGHNVSHANNATKRVWHPNLQRVRALVDGQVRNIHACAACLKAGKVLKAPRGRRRQPAPA